MITLAWNGNTITIDNYEFGNTELFEFTRVFRESRGHDTLLGRDPTWPQTHTVNLQFDFCSPDQENLVKRFLKETVGCEFTYTDPAAVAHTAILLNPDTSFVAPKRNAYTVNLNLELS